MPILKTVTASVLFAAALSAQSLTGLWDCTVTVNGTEIPFRMEFSGGGAGVAGNFFNGDERVPSTGGQLQEGSLRLNFDQYANRLEATVTEGALEGRYGRDGRWYPFRAHRAPAPSSASATGVPDISGLWEIPTKSPKGEAAWRFIVRQKGADVSAAILRVDGDTGALTGTWRDGKFVLSHFSGARPNLLEVTPAADGTLKIVQNGRTTLAALRPASARAQGLGEPTDPFHHTGVKDASAPFTVAFPDLEGRTVSLNDARFRGKVVVLAISGSWCPNCHDEAPFLEELYRQYRDQGLEVVALSFEEAEQLKTSGPPARFHQTIRNRLHRPGPGRARPVGRKASAGRELELVAHHILPGPRRQGAKRSCRFRWTGERRVLYADQTRSDRPGGAPAGRNHQRHGAVDDQASERSSSRPYHHNEAAHAATAAARNQTLVR